MNTTVIGIDLSLTSTGVAIAQHGLLKEVRNIKSKGKKGDSLTSRHQRLEQILLEITFVNADYDMTTPFVVIESPSYGSKFGSPHDRSGLWWKIVSFFEGMDMPVATVSPQGRAKYATGRGNSKKDVVLAHVVERYTNERIHIGNNDDIADAVVLAAMGSRHLGFPVETHDLPTANLEAMSGAAWPS